MGAAQPGSGRLSVPPCTFSWDYQVLSAFLASTSSPFNASAAAPQKVCEEVLTPNARGLHTPSTAGSGAALQQLWVQSLCAERASLEDEAVQH